MSANVDHIIHSGRISKKDICHLLGLVYQGGRCDHFKLNTEYFTPPVLAELGLNTEMLKKTRIFDRLKTKIIIGKFQLHLINPRLTILLS